MAQFNHTSYHTNALVEDFYSVAVHSNTHLEKNKIVLCCMILYVVWFLLYVVLKAVWLLRLRSQIYNSLIMIMFQQRLFGV